MSPEFLQTGKVADGQLLGEFLTPLGRHFGDDPGQQDRGNSAQKQNHQWNPCGLPCLLRTSTELLPTRIVPFTRHNLADENREHGGHLLGTGGEAQMLRADQLLVDAHLGRTEKGRLHGETEEADEGHPHVAHPDGEAEPTENGNLGAGRANHHVTLGEAVTEPACNGREKNEGQGNNRRCRSLKTQSDTRPNRDGETDCPSQGDQNELRHLVVEGVLGLLHDHAPVAQPLAPSRFHIRGFATHYWTRLS